VGRIGLGWNQIVRELAEWQQLQQAILHTTDRRYDVRA